MPKRPEARAFPYADAGALLAETFAAFLPPRRISVAEHAALNRWVPSPTGGHLQRWDHATAPYLAEPQAALSDDAIDTVCIVGPGASGKTMVAENWLLHGIDCDPADLLWYLHTEQAQRAYVQGRIEPMLAAHERLIGHLRHGRDSVELKRFRGMRAEFLAFTPANLVNKHVARIVSDEYDSFDPSLGDPLPQLNTRRQAAGSDSKLLIISHPDQGLPLNTPRERQRGIMAVYADSDRRSFWWRCPHCGAYSSATPGAAREMVLTWPTDAPLETVAAEARLLCPVSGCLIAEHERPAMLATGRWVAAGQRCEEDGRIFGDRMATAIAGFWITGIMSPFVKDGIAGLARNRAAAERELAATGEDGSLRAVMVKGWGVPFAPPRQVGTIEAAALAERADPGLRLGEVPEGVRVLVTGVDVQANRFELLTRGYGVGLESWVVDVRTIPAEPATDPRAWDDLLKLLGTLSYPLAGDDKGRHMRVRCAVFDSMGQPGVTEQAYAAWRRARRAGLTRRMGRINGRDAWTMAPSKGASAAQAMALAVQYPDSVRKDRRAQARGEVPLLVFNPNTHKDQLAAQLDRAEAGPGTVHFPAELRGDGPPFAWFEQLAAERRNRRGTWEPDGAHRRNEAWDLMVLCGVAARLHGLHRIVWESPPGWAEAWERNTMVGAPGLVAPAEAPGPGPSDAVVTLPPAAAGHLPPAVPAPAPLQRGAPNMAALRRAMIGRAAGSRPAA